MTTEDNVKKLELELNDIEVAEFVAMIHGLMQYYCLTNKNADFAAMLAALVYGSIMELTDTTDTPTVIDDEDLLSKVIMKTS